MPLSGIVLAAGAGSRAGGPKALRPGWLDRAVAVLDAAGCSPVFVVLGASADAARPLVPDGARIVVARDWAQGLSASLRAGLDAVEQESARSTTRCSIASDTGEPRRPAPSPVRVSPRAPSPSSDFTDAHARRTTPSGHNPLACAFIREIGLGRGASGGVVGRAGDIAREHPAGAGPDDATLVTLVDLPGLPVAVAERIARLASPGVLAQATYGGRPGHPVLIGGDHRSAVAASLAGDRGARAYLAAHGALEIPCDDLWDGADVDS